MNCLVFRYETMSPHNEDGTADNDSVVSVPQSVSVLVLAKQFCTIQRDRSLKILGNQGSIFRSKNGIYSPPPFWKNYILSPFRDMSFFASYCGLFALILPYFAFILPFYFSFSFPFFPFLSPFFLFLLHFPYFSIPLFTLFPPNDIGWYSPP